MSYLREFSRSDLEEVGKEARDFHKTKISYIMLQEIACRIEEIRKSGKDANEIVGGLNELLDFHDLVQGGFDRNIRNEWESRGNPLTNEEKQREASLEHEKSREELKATVLAKKTRR